ncbi:MAG: UDP-N-acetylmuramate dehydrogenase [Endozoicomonadaceae bacterium]|nr:UDP-N-acetylmuramate dehydrogenase [Endozoicomonadaceae bacterium]
MNELYYEHYNLSDHHTFQLSSRCRYFYPADHESHIPTIFNFALKKNKPVIPIGTGSNIIFREYLDAVIMPLRMKNIAIISNANIDKTQALLKISAGYSWHQIVQWSLQNNLYGLENLSLIPGTAGAAPIQNIGAYGVELSDILHEVIGYQPSKKIWRTLSNQDCQFKYRDSIFKHALRHDFIITHIILNLTHQFHPNLTYPPLKKYLSHHYENNNWSAQDISHAVCAIRNQKIPNPNKKPNAGSFFKNPIVNQKTVLQLKKKSPQMPIYKVKANVFKLSAGWFIEQCGLKGYQKNNIAVHTDHALILIQTGSANGTELLDFSSWVVDQVYLKFNILLTLEPTIYPDAIYNQA